MTFPNGTTTWVPFSQLQTLTHFLAQIIKSPYIKFPTSFSYPFASQVKFVLGKPIWETFFLILRKVHLKRKKSLKIYKARKLRKGSWKGSFSHSKLGWHVAL